VLSSVATTAPFSDIVNAIALVLAFWPLNIAIPPGVLLNATLQLFPLLSVAVNVVADTLIGWDGALAD
jgi:hypothetical protein